MTESPPLARISAAIRKFGGLIPDDSGTEWNEMMRRPALIDFTLRSLYIAKHEADAGRTPDPRVVALADSILGGES